MLEYLDHMKDNQVYSVQSDDSSEEEIDGADPAELKKKAIRLAHALAVLAIKPSTFHYLQTTSKLDGLRELLEDSMKERVQTFHLRKSGSVPPPEIDANKKRPVGTRSQKGEYTPYVNETADLPTIHEAYQYLMKTYVDDVVNARKKLKIAKNAAKAVSALDCKIKEPAKEAKKSKKDSKHSEEEKNLEEEKVLCDEIEHLMNETLGVDSMMFGSSRPGSRRESRNSLGLEEITSISRRASNASIGLSNSRRGSKSSQKKKRPAK